MSSSRLAQPVERVVGRVQARRVRIGPRPKQRVEYESLTAGGATRDEIIAALVGTTTWLAKMMGKAGARRPRTFH